MFWSVVREVWRRCKLEMIFLSLGAVVLVVLHATGWIWLIHTALSDAIPEKPMNPIVLLSLLAGTGLVFDSLRKPRP